MTSAKSATEVSEEDIRDGMRIDWDAPIPMDDGVVLRADIFRPVDNGKYPAILSYGPYAKGLAFQEGFKAAWDLMAKENPDVLAGSSNKYQNWEVVDPEKWVPDGYVVVRVDSRGSGRSPGVLDMWSPREAEDLYQCIEWAAAQPWCNGNVGLNGISYYAMNQWWVAGLKPPHLAAICAWEGAADYYRDVVRHGGILCEFLTYLARVAVNTVQHGVGEHGRRSRVTGELVAGPETLPDEERARNRVNVDEWVHELDDEAHRARSAKWERVDVPLLSAANWGGQGLHPRGNFEAFMHAVSKQKWLEVHGGSHWAEFYTDYGVGLQKRFFGDFLKREDTGWNRQPPVQLNIRHIDRFLIRHENEWPIARTHWTKFFLDPANRVLTRAAGAGEHRIDYDTCGEGVTFHTPPLQEEEEITGPAAAKLWLSSHTTDADIFVVLRVIAPDGTEVAFHGSNDPRTPIGLGWLRASHRQLDPKLTRPHRPYHTHDQIQPLTPGEPVELDVEIWPTCIVVPPGYRIGFSVRGKDYAYPGPDLNAVGASYGPAKGVGPFTHADPRDRPAEIFATTNTLHFGGGRWPYVLLPIIPKRLP
jgi:uncharacterized protein